MKTLTIGDVSIDNVVEMPITFEPDWLLHEATPEGVLREADWLGPNLIDIKTGTLKLVIQSFVVRTPDQNIVLDTGNGNGRERPSVPFFHRLETNFLDNLRKVVDPNDVTMVQCSHFHVDHVGWNVMQGDQGFVPTFPNARYLFNEQEYRWWLDAHSRNLGSPQAKAAFFECVEPLVRSGQAELISPDFVLAASADYSVSLEEFPGHTMHQVGVHIRSRGQHVLYAADIVHHAVQFAHPSWRSRPDADPVLGEQTVRRVIADYAGTDTLFLTAHSPDPTVCRLEPYNGAARLVFAEQKG